MREMTIRELAEIMEGKVVQGREEAIVKGFCTDTRQLKFGDLFFALVGERFDAHNFLDRASGLGAGGIVISKAEASLPVNIPTILVENTLRALQLLAAYLRGTMEIPVVAITGSNGKTTTKDMVASVLAQKMNVLKNQGNFNNEIGLPLTLLQLLPEHEAMVVEMGMRGKGQISDLCHIAKPSVGVITNIGESHIELLGSRKAIAEAKTELLAALNSGQTAVLNGDEPLLRDIAEHYRCRKVFFGFGADNDLRATNINTEAGDQTRFTLNYQGQAYSVTIPLLGAHNIMNALAAIGVGLTLGLTVAEIVAGLQQVSISGMRLQLLQNNGITIINDTYNASPASMEAALQVLAGYPAKRRLAVLGDMLELGAFQTEGHKRVGAKVAQLRIDLLLTVGELSTVIYDEAKARGMYKDRLLGFRTNKDALKVLKNILRPGDAVLVKGSRSMRMEEIVNGLMG